MALFEEQTNTLEQVPSLAPELWRPGSPDMQTYIDRFCESWGITTPDFIEQNPTIPTTLSQSLSNLSTYISGFNEPWGNTHNETTAATLENTGLSSDRTVASPWPDAPEALSPPLRFVYPAYTHVSDTTDVLKEVLDAQTPESCEVSEGGFALNPQDYMSLGAYTPPSHELCATPFGSYSQRQSFSSGPVAPSKRLSPGRHNAPVSLPYPSPSSRSLVHKKLSLNIPSSFIESESRRSPKVDPAVFFTPDPDDRYERISPRIMPYQITSTSNISLPRARRGRISVPLREWRPLRAYKVPSDALGVIDFWTKDISTGKNIPGTYLADRFQEDSGRALINESNLPFPQKKEKGFNLRILWPGYPDEFSKKISIHRPLSECTVRDVRDWVFNALSDFIRTGAVRQVSEIPFWRVGAEDQNAIHLEDLVLVRLRQAGKGTWVPEIDLLDWDRTV